MTQTPVTEAPENVPVHVALIRVMAEVQNVGKDGLYSDKTGTRYNFRGVDAVVNAVGPALRTHGVFGLPFVENVTYRDTQTSGGKNARGCEVTVRYTIYGPTGDKLEDPVVVVAEALDNSDKGTAKAMSVAYRTLWLQLLCIPTDDPDPDADHKTLSKPRAKKADPGWFDAMVSEIEAAATKDVLQALWRRINEAGASGQATAGQVNNLKQRVSKQTEAKGLGAPAVAQRKSAQPADGWPAVAKPTEVTS